MAIRRPAARARGSARSTACRARSTPTRARVPAPPSSRAWPRDGTAGVSAARLPEFSYPWSHDAAVILYSDGLTSHLSLSSYPGLLQRHPSLIAGVLYRDFTRGRDDATVVVCRELAA